ncbi:MAG TPA: nuclear transport factor 2 family protein [Candidatus Methylomirabilis sp.]|nr:nuclear transport factor 2 family protein [Candidatus Methylomirabilis sp.]HEV8662948.1 nuclear transport factor 2 family protein [Candidatus Methylomirabilis sp.]
MANARDDLTQVREANERFYKAFEHLSLEEMEAVWAQTPGVVCIHPGWRLLRGWQAVRESWVLIFKNSGEVRFTLTDLRIELAGAFAWVVLTENLLSQQQGNVAVTSILATNLFQKLDGKWRMILHHSSHIIAGPTREESRTVH